MQPTARDSGDAGRSEPTGHDPPPATADTALAPCAACGRTSRDTAVAAARSSAESIHADSDSKDDVVPVAHMPSLPRHPTSPTSHAPDVPDQARTHTPSPKGSHAAGIGHDAGGPLMPPHPPGSPAPAREPSEPRSWRQWRQADIKRALGEFLESRRTHQILLILITIDAIFVLMELFYIVLHPTCPPSEKDDLPRWLEDLGYATLAIDCLFVLEIPLALYAFGLRYYGLSWRKKPVPHAFLHLFDAVVILGTVILETALKGKEQELAGLLVVLRLWRVVKVVGGVAVGVGEWDEGGSGSAALKTAKKRVAELAAENEGLRRRLRSIGEEV